ncbi:glutathione hydrolase 5 proenzyme isoform X2 [Hemicordylus capensis]|uniref:glutathione hydrolase 5 proenzyme isoform X2 n=1 Tax=Hemicordylus capensis TaxID=884348 RepID=UPI0023032716|nr:glutathione hydrolase 5 proenzyme isoform X2 [Hemicordylus capensis]
MSLWERKGCLVVLSLAVVALGLALALILTRHRCGPHRFQHAAVAADAKICSDIGRDILLCDGSAVDAAIAALICTSVLNPQSMGLGGGVIFTIYNATTGTVEVINARETAPQNMTESLLNQCRLTFLPGSQWIAVPGELRGYEEAHKRYGKLPWGRLFKPTIQLLEAGIKIPEVLNKFLNHEQLQPALKNSSLGKLFLNGRGAMMTTGETLHWPALVKTLKAVAENGTDEFYMGKTAEELVRDVQEQGGRLTLEDLKNYRAKVVKPVNISLGEYVMYSAPQPAAGPLILFILNVLKGFNFTKEYMSTPVRKAEAFHYIAETLKFANGQRAKVEDLEFSKIKEGIVRALISEPFADHIRQLIDERGDHSASHYNNPQLRMASFGTAHVSVVAADGSAVSVTSTINHPFGSMVYSEKTGIILNNELADFCMKRSSRKISPGEMPPSSMTPSILISKNGQSKLVIGGSGGLLIVPAVALDIMAELRKKGHKVAVSNLTLNVVQGISTDGSCIFPYSDKRKLGEASGY